MALVVFILRRRKPEVRKSWVSGVEKPERNLFGRKTNNPVQYIQDPQLESSSPVSDAYIPTPYTMHVPTGVPATAGSVFHPLTERPVSSAHLSPVVVRRANKLAELDQAKHLAVVGSGVSSSSASGLEPHDVPLPHSPNPATTAQRVSTAAGSSMVPVDTAPTNTAANDQQLHPHDLHLLGLPDEPPPGYDAFV